jgi:hypothetical protein
MSILARWLVIGGLEFSLDKDSELENREKEVILEIKRKEKDNR